MTFVDLPPVRIKFKRLHPEAVLPQHKTIGSSGADVYSIDEVEIPAGQVRLVRLGFSVSMPEGVEIQIRPRSGLALKNQITVLNTPGTVDSDFRGEIKVILANFSQESFLVRAGERIAQIVASYVPKTTYVEVDELDITDRGEGGFGSTGRN